MHPCPDSKCNEWNCAEHDYRYRSNPTATPRIATPRERNERDAMMIRADARAIGAVTALDTRASIRWKSSDVHSGECVSIFPDGTRVPFTRTTTRSVTRETTPRTSKVNHSNEYEKRLAQFGADGDSNH